MKLFIDTSDSDKITIRLNDKEFTMKSRVNKSQTLLPLIIEKLEEKNLNLKNISEIEVVLGPGSFTGLRVGISVANTLAWSLGIPINGSKKLAEPVY